VSVIIQFPNQRSRKVLDMRQQETYRLAYGGAFLSFLALMVMAQIKIETQYDGVALARLDDRYAGKAERAIASLESSVPLSKRGEHLSSDQAFVSRLSAIAPDISHSHRTPSSIGTDCKGAVCDLGPNYRLVYQGSGLKGADIAEGLVDEGIRGLPSSDQPALLSRLQGAAAVAYTRFEKQKLTGLAVSSDGSLAVWVLYGEADLLKGYAVFADTGERIQSVAFCPAGSQPFNASECLSEIR
jgi:hypothetical protein